MAVLQTHLTHIDATIKLFEPDFDLRSFIPKRTRTHPSYFASGEPLPI